MHENFFDFTPFSGSMEITVGYSLLELGLGFIYVCYECGLDWVTGIMGFIFCTQYEKKFINKI